MLNMMLATSLLEIVGETTIDRYVVAAAWLGLCALALVVFIASASPPRSHPH